LAVICLPVILLSLEADAHPIADESSPWSAATLEVRIIPSNQQQQNGKIKEACEEANETITLEEVANMVKIIATNQQENAKAIKEEIKNEIKDDIGSVKKMIASGCEKTNETGLVDVLNMEIKATKKEIKDLKTLLVSGSGDTNETRLEDVVKEIKDLKKLIAPTSIELDAGEPSKQALVSALVCEYLVCFYFFYFDDTV